MKLVGLTGGFASGKSTVTEIIRALGLDVLDADKIYHDLLEPKTGKPSSLAREIEERFPGVLGHNGTIDRKDLGRRVFADPNERHALERIAHPRVAEQVAREVERLEEKGARLIVYDVPLLYEKRLELSMWGVIVVWVPRQVQIDRLVRREGIAADIAAKRLDAQLPSTRNASAPPG